MKFAPLVSMLDVVPPVVPRTWQDDTSKTGNDELIFCATITCCEADWASPTPAIRIARRVRIM
jgi:hypothetical protein